MNILIVTSLLPFPLNSGGAQAQYNMIESLRKKHNIAIVYPQNANNSNYSLAQLKKRWPDVKFRRYAYTSQLRHIPFAYEKAMRALKLFLIPNSHSFKAERVLKPYGYPLTPHFVSFVEKVAKEHQANILQAEFYPYLGLAEKINLQIKTLFVHHEIRFVRDERMMVELKPTPKEQRTMKMQAREEIRLLNAYDAVITLTETDCNILRKHGVVSPIFVSPAGINTPRCNYIDRPGQAFFVGGFSHAPNQEGVRWLFEKVFPLIPDNSPNGMQELGVIGMGWKHTWFDAISAFKPKLYGFVDSIADVAGGGIMLVPILSGSGMRMKILEAAALAMPIVTTSVGKEGLAFENQVHCLVADSPQAFADAITLLLRDKALRRKLALNAQELFARNYSIESLVEVRQQVYNKMTI